MEIRNFDSETGYHELILRLEKANETLAFYKSNKEISQRDLQKLELENSALLEENSYLKKRIKNIEKNCSGIGRSSDILDSTHNPGGDSGFWGKKIVLKVPPLKLNADDNITVTSRTYKRPVSQNRLSSNSSSRRKTLELKEKAFLRFALIYNL